MTVCGASIQTSIHSTRMPAAPVMNRLLYVGYGIGVVPSALALNSACKYFERVALRVVYNLSGKSGGSAQLPHI